MPSPSPMVDNPSSPYAMAEQVVSHHATAFIANEETVFEPVPWDTTPVLVATPRTWLTPRDAWSLSRRNACRRATDSVSLWVGELIRAVRRCSPNAGARHLSLYPIWRQFGNLPHHVRAFPWTHRYSSIH